MQDNIRMPEDNGFSERVMQRLPRRPINTAWTTAFEVVVLTVGCLFLLSQVDLTEVFCDLSLRALQFVTYLRYADFTFNPLYLVAILIVLAVWGGTRIKALT